MYSFESRIRYSETDANGRLSTEKLIDYFQDCSTFQSEDTGIGVERMRARGLAWIIVYWRVEIHRMPVLGEKVRIGTKPYEMKGSVGLRNFLMETTEGELLACAASVWTLVDTQTMYPVRIPPEILTQYPLEERLNMNYDARKIRLPELAGEELAPLTVQEYHLDTNKHMNNGQYVRIAAGFLPPEREVDVLRIEYRRQAVLGDHITPVLYTMPAPDRRFASVLSEDTEISAAESAGVCISLNADDGKPYAIMETHFRVKQRDGRTRITDSDV